MHLAFYKARPDACAVIHLHPTCAIAYLTLLTEATLDAIPAYSSALFSRLAGRVPMIDYYPVGSTEMHHAIADLAPHFYTILLRQHGITEWLPRPYPRQWELWKRSNNAAILHC